MARQATVYLVRDPHTGLPVLAGLTAVMLADLIARVHSNSPGALPWRTRKVTVNDAAENVHRNGSETTFTSVEGAGILRGLVFGILTMGAGCAGGVYVPSCCLASTRLQEGVGESAFEPSRGV